GTCPISQTSRNLMEDMLPLGEEPNEGKLLVKELLKLMCDKKNNFLFTDTRCFVLSPDFKLADESQVLLKVPRKNNMYSVDMKNIVPKECLTCLVAKATLDESMLWHRRLGHVNFKTINKLVKENLVRGLPSKHFENDQTCVAYLKGKQHKASFVTNDYSRFTWVFFLATKDETSGILKSFITEIENLVDKKVKIIRCDNGTEFKNRVMSEFCKQKGIKREFSVARTPQQNGVAERRNRTLIEAARTMLADSKLPTTFWAEAVNTACYVQNRVLVVKPHNKTPYELFRGRTPALSFMRPFGCHVTILNTLDYLGKFDGKSDEGFFVGYLMNSKAFRVYNIRTRKVEENLHIRFLEDKPIIAGDGPKWLFDIDVLTKSMNYVPVVAGTNSNDSVGTEESMLTMDEQNLSSDARKKDDEGVSKETGIDDQERPKNSSQYVNTTGPSINTANSNVNTVDMSNITTTYLVPSTPNTRIHKDHSLDHVISDVQSGVLTRRMTKTTNEQGFISAVYEGKTHEDLHYLSVFLFPILGRAQKAKEPVVLNGYTGIRKIKEMDVKSAFMYGKIEEEVYVCQPIGFEDPEFPDRDSPFDLEAYSYSDYAGASLDMKSTTGGCQFIGSRLISWQCKKQTIVVNSTTKAEYVAVASCCGQAREAKMCLRSWGRTEYARALVEVLAEKELMEAIFIAIPYSDGKGHTLATIDIEYEWRPPHCKTCKIFDHTNEKCPKLPKEAEPVLDTNDGFTKPKLNLQYRRVDHALNVKEVSLSNSFAALGDEEDTACSDETNWLCTKQKLTAINKIDSEEVDEEIGLNLSPKQSEVRHVIHENGLSLVSIIKSHVATSRLELLCTRNACSRVGKVGKESEEY
ncbi:putative ribonuclease H-like domain-containing protein, partial [Tanacetum coccineum]